MSDDWKGLHLIKSKPKTSEERKTGNLSIVSSLAHKRRTKAGCNMSRAGGPWAVSINNWRINGLLEREGQ